MHTRAVGGGHGRRTVLIRPLRDGDTETVAAVFGELSDASRRARFNGAKPCLSKAELDQLAAVDARRHALVAYVDGDPRPIGIARLVRGDDDTAELAFAVVDRCQRRGVGSALAAELLALARAAGIRQVTALVGAENRAGLDFLRRCAKVFDVRLDGADFIVRASTFPRWARST